MSAQVVRYVDPRGGRFAAWITTFVLAAVVLSGSGALLAAQTAVFLAGAVFGLRRAPYSALFRLVRRVARLRPPAELESEAPLRFAQTVGAAFGIVGVLGFAAGSTVVGTTATAFALVAAFLNAAFGICLGCEIYLIALRTSGRGTKPRFVPARTITEGSSA
jgi:Domain of unknown function (DUF4395)